MQLSGEALKDDNDFIRQQEQRGSSKLCLGKCDVIKEDREPRLKSTGHKAGHLAAAESQGSLNARLRQGATVGRQAVGKNPNVANSWEGQKLQEEAAAIGQARGKQGHCSWWSLQKKEIQIMETENAGLYWSLHPTPPSPAPPSLSLPWCKHLFKKNVFKH